MGIYVYSFLLEFISFEDNENKKIILKIVETTFKIKE